MAWFEKEAATYPCTTRWVSKDWIVGFGGEEVFARAHAVETDESYDPLHRGSLSVHGVVVETEYLSHFLEEDWVVDFASRAGRVIPVVVVP